MKTTSSTSTGLSFRVVPPINITYQFEDIHYEVTHSMGRIMYWCAEAANS